jgi:hypothetical protein
MRPELSQDYAVDSRYKGGKRAVDNSAGKAFVMSFLERRRASQAPDATTERQVEDRFIVQGPGDTNYSFKNAFRASK